MDLIVFCIAGTYNQHCQLELHFYNHVDNLFASLCFCFLSYFLLLTNYTDTISSKQKAVKQLHKKKQPRLLGTVFFKCDSKD